MRKHPVISLLQPWAYLVCIGAKTIETRCRNTKFRGQILVHASQDRKWYDRLQNESIFKDYLLDKTMAFGAVIGHVTIYGTGTSENGLKYLEQWRNEEKVTLEKAFGDFSPNRFVYLLSNPQLFDQPITGIKGQVTIPWQYHSDKDLFLKPSDTMTDQELTEFSQHTNIQP